MKLHLLSSRPAQHWLPISENRVQCTLCPRHCKTRNGQMGYCGVRGTIDDELHTFNYGLALAATEEVIETEAINHYSPNARILSMGNVGCMMSCSFCQNWQTSQVKHLDQKQVRNYTPQQLVDICLDNGIGVISWTYNDPVVWHEFVVETSTLAQKNGLKTLYKSAFYIEAAPVDELIDCIDIFSLSLKSLSEEFYRKVTKAKLKPVLERIKQVARSNRHLEISYLVIPQLNDSDEDIKRAIAWVLEHVGAQVPLHFVAFHPAYKYTQVERTPLASLERARLMAQTMGMQYVYLGNTHQSGLNDTVCKQCGTVQVRRYGLNAEPMNLTVNGCCTNCGEQSVITEALKALAEKKLPATTGDLRHSIELLWTSEAQSAHIMLTEGQPIPENIRLRPLGVHQTTERLLHHGLDRFIVARQSPEDQGIVISWDSDNQYQFFPVLDRAHFPVS
jgi:pyruvate formate lyase activating enzyme